jgi:hypothetical protein
MWFCIFPVSRPVRSAVTMEGSLEGQPCDCSLPSDGVGRAANRVNVPVQVQLLARCDDLKGSLHEQRQIVFNSGVDKRPL